MLDLLAAHDWPDGFDSTVIVVFLTTSLLLPALGNFFLVADIRAYWRALRGTLVTVAAHVSHIPAWARRQTPACIRSLGLTLPCTEHDVKRAYRRLAEASHPDRGGSKQRFLLLQQQCEHALQFVRQQVDYPQDEPS